MHRHAKNCIDPCVDNGFSIQLLAMGSLRDDAIVETVARKIMSCMEFGANEAVMSHSHLQYTAEHEQTTVPQRRERDQAEHRACSVFDFLFVCFIFVDMRRQANFFFFFFFIIHREAGASFYLFIYFSSLKCVEYQSTVRMKR